jgi:hypothetical protein
MFRRLRTTSLAGSSAIVLVLAVSGMVAAASVLTAIAAPVADPDEPTVVDTRTTWEDLDGDGLDDDCDDAVEANEEAALGADEAVDLDGDGTISVSEAAQSDRIGGMNCNHGGYVNWVANETCDTDDAGEPVADEGGETGEVDADEVVADEPGETDADEATADCEAAEEEEEPAQETAEDEQPTECDAAAPDEGTPEDGDAEEPATEVVNNGHGKVVREVAQDKDAVGGKNCNHGGAVSEASHEDNEARKAARDAEKAARDAARDAAKAEREAARDAKRESKGSKGKGHGH